MFRRIPIGPMLAALAVFLTGSARAGDSAAQPRCVGDLGQTSRLAFAGNQSIPEGQLRKALAKDLGFVLASHPAALLPDCLVAVRSALERGYRACGFPEVKIETDFQRSPDGQERLGVKITEGPRFRNGKVVVTGTKDVEAAAVVAALTQAKPTEADPLLALIDAEMDPLVAKRDQARAQDATPDPQTEGESSNKKPSPLCMNADPDPEVLWTSGEPADFTPGAAESARTKVQEALAALGHPMARWTNRMERRGDGTCDLVVAVEDEGPVSAVGSVKVLGIHRTKAEQVMELCHLKVGDPLDPPRLAAARMALWECGRFWPFSVKALPRTPAAAEVDVVIDVGELEAPPPLEAAPTAVQEAFIRMARQMNHAFTRRPFHWTGQAGGVPIEIGYIPGQTIIARIRKSESSQEGVFFSLEEKETRVLLHNKDGDIFFSLPIAGQQVRANLKLIPEINESGQATAYLSFGAGLRTLKSGLPIRFDLLVAPASCFLTKTRMVIEDGRLVVTSPEGEKQFAADAATGDLVEIAGGRAGFDEAAVQGLRAELDRAAAAPGTRRTALAWSDLLADGLASALERLAASKPAEVKEAGPAQKDGGSLAESLDQMIGGLAADWAPGAAALTPAQIGATRRLSGRLLGPVILDPLDQIFGSNEEQENTFSIPFDPSRQSQMTMPLLLGLGYVEFSEEFLPRDTWMSTLSREMLFFLAGDQLYTARTLDSLLEDPGIGPLGCLLTAQLVGKVDPNRARRFEEKALRQCTAEAFRKDWTLALHEGSGLERAVRNLLDALAKLTPQDEADLALVLGAEKMGWAKDFLTALRSMPADQSVVGGISPHMDALWNRFIGPDLKNSLEKHLHPPVDPALVAATVNGVPIPRSIMRFLVRVSVQPLPGTVDREPGGDPWALACRHAVRFVLARQDFLVRGGTLEPAKIDQGFQASLPDALKKADDEGFRKVCGLTRAEARSLYEMDAVIEFMGNQLTANLAAPTPEEIAAWRAGPGAELFNETHVHQFRVPCPDGSFFHGRVVAVDRTRAVRAWLVQGLPADVLIAATTDQGEMVAGRCAGWLSNYALQPILFESLGPLPSGGFSPPVVGAGQCYLFQAFARRPAAAPAPDLADQAVKPRVARQKAFDVLAAWLAGLEDHAEIVLIDGPRLDPAQEAAQVMHATEEMLASPRQNLVGRLGLFWMRLKQNDQAATDRALDDLLKPPTLEAKPLGLLAEAVAQAGDKARSDRLRQAASQAEQEAKGR